MPEGTEPTGAQAVPSQQPQAGTPPANPQAGAATPTSTPTQPTGDELMSLDEAKKLRAEANALRKRIKEVDDAKAAEELAKLGEVEKATKQLQAATAQLETYRAKIADYAVQIAASKLGIRDPEVAATLIRPQLTLGDDGAPTNADDLLKELLKNKPYLKQDETPAQPPRGPSAGPTNPGRGAGGTGALSWDVIGRMTPQEYDGRRAEIQQWMARNPLGRR